MAGRHIKAPTLSIPCLLCLFVRYHAPRPWAVFLFFYSLSILHNSSGTCVVYRHANRAGNVHTTRHQMLWAASEVDTGTKLHTIHSDFTFLSVYFFSGFQDKTLINLTALNIRANKTILKDLLEKCIDEYNKFMTPVNLSKQLLSCLLLDRGINIEKKSLIFR